MAIDLIAQGLALNSVRVTINQGHVFETTTTRDNYFVAHPLELKEGIYIFCMSQLQRYENGTWNDRAVLMFTNSNIINADNVILDKANFTTILKKYTGDDAQGLFDYIDKIQEFPSGVMYIGEKDTLNSWRISKIGMGLSFSRYQNGEYVNIYTVENSSTTDNYYINCPEGRLAYVTEDKKSHTLIKSSTDLKGCQINNVDGRISLLNNGTMTSYHPIDEKKMIDINEINQDDGIKNAQIIEKYSQEIVTSSNLLLFGVNKYFVMECEPNTKVRMYITDKETGNILGQSCSYNSFASGCGNEVIIGENKIDFSEPVPMLEGKDILINAQFSNPIKVQGMTKEISSKSQFYMRFNGFIQNLKEENIATREWVNENTLEEAPNNDCAYVRKNNKWEFSYNIPDVLTNKCYLRKSNAWVEYIPKIDIFTFGEKRNYLKNDFASYNDKLYKALKDTTRSPYNTYTGKSDIEMPSIDPYSFYSSEDWTQVQLFVPFVSKSNETITGFRLNIETPAPIENSYICLAERVGSGDDSVAKLLTTETFVANNGNLEYKLVSPFNVIKDKNYELYVLLPSKNIIKIIGSYISILEDSVLKVGLVKGTPYSTAFDQRKTDDKSIPEIGQEYKFHQGSWALGIVELTPIIESTTLRDWIEVVGGEGGIATNVYWDDILEKPSGIITEESLTMDAHQGVTLSPLGDGIQLSSKVKENPRANMMKYDSKYNCISVGNDAMNTIIQSSNRMMSRKILSNKTIKSEYGKDTKLLSKDFYIPFVPITNLIKPMRLKVYAFEPCVLDISINNLPVCDKVNCIVGENVIELRKSCIDVKYGKEISVKVSSDKESLLGDKISNIEYLYYEFDYTIYQEGEIITNNFENDRVLLNEFGKIIVPSVNGDIKNIISMDSDISIFGDAKNNVEVISKDKPNMIYVKENVQIRSTDKADVLHERSYTSAISLKEEDVEFYIESIQFEIAKPSMIRAIINGIPYGDPRQVMQKGQVILRPLDGRYASAIDTIQIDISSSNYDVFYGDASKENTTPNFILNLDKFAFGKISSEEYAHKINIDNVDTDGNKENLRVVGSIFQSRINIKSSDMICRAPSRCNPIRIPIPYNDEIYFDGNYKMEEDEKITIKFREFKIGYSKTRVEAYFDVYKQDGFNKDMTPETEETKKLFKARSLNGIDINECHNIVFFDSGNIEYHVFFDYYEGDNIEFEFSKNIDFSNCHMNIQMSTIPNDHESTKKNMYNMELLNIEGKIKPEAVGNGIFVSRDEYFDTIRNIDILRGDNLYINEYTPKIFSSYKPQLEGSISYETPSVTKVDIPTMAFKNEYVATILKSCNIVGDDFLKFMIHNFGGVQIYKSNIIKMLVRVYRSEPDIPIKINTESVMPLGENGVKLDYTFEMSTNREYYELEYVLNGASSELQLKIGDGNDWSNLAVVIMFSSVEGEITDVPLFQRDGKINLNLYDSWSSKIDLTEEENIELRMSNKEFFKNIDLNAIKIDVKNIPNKPEIRKDSVGEYIYYPPNTSLDVVGQMIQYTIPIPSEFRERYVAVELGFDETRDGIPFIVDEDFYVVNHPYLKKKITKEYDSTIITFKIISTSGMEEIMIRGVAHPYENRHSSMSECQTRFIRFRTVGNMPREIPMFINNKFNKELYDDGSWNMEVDLTIPQNINVKKQSSNTEYILYHTIPFMRSTEWIPNEYIKINSHFPKEEIIECTYFTIKGIDPPHNYTDISVKYRLEVKHKDGSKEYIDCLACTGLSKNIYNKIITPISKECEVSLFCNSLNDPFGYLPSDNYNVDFYKTSGSIINTPLFDFSTGLINEQILPTPIVKTKKLIGTMPTTQGNSVMVNHNLNYEKITGVSCLVDDGLGRKIIPNSNSISGCEYSIRITASTITIDTTSNNSINLLNRPIIIYVNYE